MLRKERTVGYVLTGAGLVGVLISFIIQTSDFDPTAFGIAIFAVIVAIVGISLVLESPKDDADAQS